MYNYIRLQIWGKNRFWPHLSTKADYFCSLYEGFSESKASYFIILTDGLRGGCWWHSSRRGSFSPITYNWWGDSYN